MRSLDLQSMHSCLLKADIPMERIKLAGEEGGLDSVFEALYSRVDQDNFRSYDIGIIGAGDFGIALARSFKPSVNILFYDVEPVRNIFSRTTKLSTNRSYVEYLSDNIEFTSDLRQFLNVNFIVLSIPANALPSMIDEIKRILPVSYKDKQYILVSKGFVGRGYIPHRWLQKNGIPFEQIIWASGGNVAQDVVGKVGLKIAVVSINKNRKARRKFSSFFNKQYLVPLEYSGSALLACELGGILKNYYAGFGRYLLVTYGEEVLERYKYIVRKEFRRAVRIVSSAPSVSIRGWVIRKASHGPAFWEDLDVTIRGGRNGFFGECVFNGGAVAEVLDKVGLVESFKTVFSTLSLFNRLSRSAFNKLPILKSILEVYEDLHIEYLNSGDASISKDAVGIVKFIESKVLN